MYFAGGEILMKRINKIVGLSIFAFFILSLNMGAQPNFVDNKDHYQELCATKSSFNANRSVCIAFETYLNEKRDSATNQAQNIQNQVAEVQGNIEKTLAIIKENEKLIIQKTEEIENVKRRIDATIERIESLEEELLERFALMQKMDTENFLIDFIMASTSLNDFLLKWDGINAITTSTNLIIDNLADQREQLVEQEAQLVEDEAALQTQIETQEQLLKEFRTNEANLYQQLAKANETKVAFNDQLNNLNLADLEDELNNATPPIQTPLQPEQSEQEQTCC